MSNDRAPSFWLEIVLFLILLFLVGTIVFALLGPYFSMQLGGICSQYSLPCDFLN
jgi:hypothetical protein